MLGLAVAAFLAFFLLHRLARKWGRRAASFLCHWLSRRPVIAPDLSRDAFAQIPVDPLHKVPGHSHPSAAGYRTAASHTLRRMATFCGVEPYMVQMSAADQRHGMRGTRDWYWAKDTNAGSRNDRLKPDDILGLIDVDYYLDMPEFLKEHRNPVILYTMVPSKATDHTDDTAFHFEADGQLRTRIAGSGRYLHHLWDYGNDSISVTKKFLGVIPWRVVTYAVERKQVAEHRQLVLLAPIREFHGIAAILATWLLESKELERFDPIVTTKSGKKFVRFEVVTNEGIQTTTALPGCKLSATVSAIDDDCIAASARLNTTSLMLSSAAAWLDNNRAAAAVLTEYHRESIGAKVPTVYPVSLGVRAYDFAVDVHDQVDRPKIEAFMSPLVHEAYAPVINKAAEERCVKGRINDLKKPEPKPNRFVDRCIDEFAELVINGERLEPVSHEYVFEKQTKAAQRLSILRAQFSGGRRRRVLKCFLKAEAYQGPKDPRNISTYNDADKLDMATYALSLSEYLKKYDWYAPGKTPLEIAHIVAARCRKARKLVNCSDYIRMDGNVTRRLREVDRAVSMRAFPTYRKELNELLKRNVDNLGILPLGTTFDQGPSHGSGCPATSVFQTLRNVFIIYLAFRHTNYPGTSRTYTPEEAFEALGIYLGDDGLTGDLPLSSLLWAAEKVGMEVESQVIEHGDRGVNFLARYYSPSVWNGGVDSMTDIRRTLSKFHTCVRLPQGVKPEQKLAEKALAYNMTDPNTPIIGPLCAKALQYIPNACMSLGIASYWARHPREVQYPNENYDGWMEAEVAVSIPEFDYTIFNNWIDKTRSVQELLNAPLCAEPKRPETKVPVIVNDELIVPEPEIVPPKPSGIAAAKPKRSRGQSKTRSVDERTPLLKPKTKGVVVTLANGKTINTRTGSIHAEGPIMRW